MIDKLKKVCNKIYTISRARRRDYKLTPLEEPYLLAEVPTDSMQARLPESSANPPTLEVNIPVSNVGGGYLEVKKVRLDSAAGKWLSTDSVRANFRLLRNSDASKRITLQLRENALAVRKYKGSIQIVSNSASSDFSNVQVNLEIPKIQAPLLYISHELVNFGRISLLKIIATIRTEDDESPKDFYLAGYFGKSIPKQLFFRKELNQTVSVNFVLDGKKYLYKFHIDSENIIMPESIYSMEDREDKKIEIRFARRKLRISNLGQQAFNGTVKGSAPWCIVDQEEVSLDGLTNDVIGLETDPAQMQFGENLGELFISSQKDADERYIVRLRATTVVKGTVGGKPEIILIKKETAQEFTRYVNKITRGSLKLELNPKRLDFGELPLFKEVAFRFYDETARRVYLLGDFNNWKKKDILVDEAKANHFLVELSLEEGEYFYQFEVDGRHRLAPDAADEVFVGQHGLCSKLTLGRYSKTVRIFNFGERAFTGTIETEAQCLKIEQQNIWIPSNTAIQLTVKLVPDLMSPGKNLGVVYIKSSENPEDRYELEVTARMNTSGTVPIFNQRQFKLENFQKGGRCEFDLPIEIVGRGRLKGIISAPRRIREELELWNVNPLVKKQVFQKIEVNYDDFSSSLAGFTAYVMTDCYIWDYKRTKLQYDYEMPFLKKSVPSVYFPRTLVDEKQTAILKIWRSDGRDVDLEMEIPEDLRICLDARPSGNSCEFTFYPRRVKDKEYLTGRIKIVDSLTGLTDYIQFGANIATTFINIKLDEMPKKISDPNRDSIMLAISNVGAEDYRISEMKFRQGLFICQPEVGAEFVIPQGKTRHFTLMVTKQAQLFGKERVVDTLTIISNDSDTPEQNISIQAILQPKISVIKRLLS